VPVKANQARVKTRWKLILRQPINTAHVRLSSRSIATEFYDDDAND